MYLSVPTQTLQSTCHKAVHDSSVLLFYLTYFASLSSVTVVVGEVGGYFFF